MRADPYLPKYLESTFSQRMVSQTLGIDLLGLQILVYHRGKLKQESGEILRRNSAC